MNLRCMLFALILGVISGSAVVRAQAGPGDCPNDSKLYSMVGQPQCLATDLAHGGVW